MNRFFKLSPWVFVFIIGCKSSPDTHVEKSTKDTAVSMSPGQDSSGRTLTLNDSLLRVHRRDSILLRLTHNILTALKNKSYPTFSNYIDPVSGVRFSPYGFVDTVHDVILSKRKFIEQLNKQDRIVWGEFDGGAGPIEMTLNNYMQRFVYDVDFVKPEKRSVNQFIGSGNSLNNLLAVYTNCDFTESHFSGFEQKYQGMDWKSLRLVFRERKGKYYLAGIVHDEWTI